MAKQHEKHAFLRELPDDIAQSIPRDGPPLSFSTFARFLRLEQDDKGDINKQIIHLNKMTHRRNHNKPERHKTKRLTQTHRKRLGLYSLGRRDVTYAQMTSLRTLWEEYMAKLINVELLEKSNWDNSPQHPMFESLSLKLYKADYHGAVLTVSSSTCPSLVGARGVVVMDTKNCFKMVGEDDVCRTVPKKTCQFEFSLKRLRFSFFGHNFIVRPADRSSKKVKLVKPPVLGR